MFITYFWVPRAVWKNKPTMIDYWLIRKYTNEYDDAGHSTASGFIGELFMDFGKYLAVLIFFFIGMILSKINKLLLATPSDSYFKIIVKGSVLAWVFFMVRSIMTSSFMFLFIVLSAYIISKIFKKWNIIKS